MCKHLLNWCWWMPISLSLNIKLSLHRHHRRAYVLCTQTYTYVMYTYIYIYIYIYKYYICNVYIYILYTYTYWTLGFSTSCLFQLKYLQSNTCPIGWCGGGFEINGLVSGRIYGKPWYLTVPPGEIGCPVRNSWAVSKKRQSPPWICMEFCM